MKVLIDHHNPFVLAHGGLQIQIEQTRVALAGLGVDVEFLRWWDEAQRGDLIHFFGLPPPAYIRQAQAKGMKVVISLLLGGTGARSPRALRAQWLANRGIERFLPRRIVERMQWESYREADACIALTPWEAHLMRWLFRAPAERVQVIANGVEPEFFEPGPEVRSEWLVTTASILPVKRIVETARAAVVAGTPYWVIGRAFAEDDPYYREFLEIQRAHPGIIRYEGPVASRVALAQIYRQARGFVMLSQWETLSLSALEATACGCPLLLSDLPWARTTFGERAMYCPLTASTEATAAQLRLFHDRCPQLAPAARPLTWHQVGEQLAGLYGRLTGFCR